MSPEKTVRRLKTYAGAQGYVYQYYFVGERAALADDAEASATEFVFDVTSDRKITYAVSVFLPQKSLRNPAKPARPKFPRSRNSYSENTSSSGFGVFLFALLATI